MAALDPPAPSSLPPAANESALDAHYERAMREETNAALARGALIALVLAVISCLGVPVAMLLDPGLSLVPPWIFTFVCVIACTVLYVLAKRRAVWGSLAWWVLLSFVSLPTLFFFACELTLPAGAATYLNGPLSYLYLVLIVVTGSTFRARLALVAGVVAAVGYSVCVALALSELARIAHPDAVLADDLREPPIYVFKAMMLLAAGGVTAGLSVIAKRLTLRVVAESQQAVVLSRLFGEYVSEEVREKLLHDPPPAGGEQKEVAVLFSDLRGFTTASEAMPPAELVRRLNAYFDAMVAPIREHGGVVDKFVGDAIMAVFGGVLALDDPRGAAVHAALGMQERLAALNARWALEGLAPFEAGIGVHAGPVVIGSIGSADRKDFTVIGDTVNTASRVEGLTKDHGRPSLITSAGFEGLPGELRDRCEPLGTASVKGRAAGVELYALRGA